MAQLRDWLFRTLRPGRYEQKRYLAALPTTHVWECPLGDFACGNYDPGKLAEMRAEHEASHAKGLL